MGLGLFFCKVCRKIISPGGARVLKSAHHDAAVVFGGVKYNKRNRPRGDDMYPVFWTLDEK